jgi:hypothetical protein
VKNRLAARAAKDLLRRHGDLLYQKFAIPRSVCGFTQNLLMSLRAKQMGQRITCCLRVRFTAKVSSMKLSRD